MYFASAYIFCSRRGSSSSRPATQATISSSAKASPKICATSFSSSHFRGKKCFSLRHAEQALDEALPSLVFSWMLECYERCTIVCRGGLWRTSTALSFPPRPTRCQLCMVRRCSRQPQGRTLFALIPRSHCNMSVCFFIVICASFKVH